MKVGFIGLGIMGRPMALNILKAGFELMVHTRNPKPLQELEKAGAAVAPSRKALGEWADMVITMVPNAPEVEAVLFGEDGAAQGMASGKLVCDMSSINPQASKAISEKLAQKGIAFIDAPVSGGEPKAIDGTLTIMVGGSEEDFARALPVLEAMSSAVVRVGEVGSGNTTKLANQIIGAINIAAICEAMTLAKNAGVDPEIMYQAIRGGLSGSTMLDAKAPMMIAGNREPGFKIALHTKDMRNVLATAKDLGLALPFTEQITAVLEDLNDAGFGEEDHSSILRYYENLNHYHLGDKA